MNKAFYRKYRSKKLSEVVGQKHITTVLDLALKKDKIGHAYLFTGPRGVGKTSVARILAHEINKIPYEDEDTHPDIIEIDAASNNGVDDVRRLREQIQTAPFEAKKRIYIIDEVHMLSKAAFNALLKTLEEPPEHAVFILATTDAHKLPATIISRTQQFVFHYISEDDICQHLRHIADSENIKITDDALKLIAQKGGGSFRDSISLLDQISSLSDGEITRAILEDVLGLAPKEEIDNLVSAYLSQNAGEIISSIENIKKSGADLNSFIAQFVDEIKARIEQNPSLVSLLMPLNEARNSAFAELELLSILINPVASPIVAQPKPKPKAIKKTIVKQDKIKEDIKPAEEPIANIPISDIPKNDKPSDEKGIEEEKKETSKANSEDLGDFSWNDFVNAVKEITPTVWAVLSQSEYEIDDGVIKIYTGRKIKKTQLDKAQNRTVLGTALKNIGADGWVIETFAEQKPPEDEVVAEILDIMGGGEEVVLDE